MNDSKKDLVEYFLDCLVHWYADKKDISLEEFNDHPLNDLGKVKVIKLHFFACSTENEMLKLFKEFSAMPYGHVEQDVYKLIEELDNFEITGNTMQIHDLKYEYSLSKANRNIIDGAIKKLKDVNFSIIELSAFDLVELSHKWLSWSYTFSEARKENSYCKHIDAKLIMRETKLYSL